jgi:hypothetical protein
MGCISHDCKLDLVTIRGNLTGDQYIRDVFFCLQILIRPSVTWNRNRLSSDQWMLRQVVKFKSRRAKHHAKRNHWCRSDKMGRLITLLDFSPADFKRFHTVLADRRLFGNHCLYRTGLVANGIRLTKQYSVLSSCCDVTCGLLDLYRWQIIGMRSTWISFKAIGRQMGYHYTVKEKHTQTNTLKDL